MNPTFARSASRSAFAILTTIAILSAGQAEADAPPVVRVRSADGAVRVEGTVRIDVPSPVLWRVLTDYDNLESFIGPLTDSRILDVREDGTYIVEQTSVARFLFLSERSRAVLRVRHHDRRRITTSLVDGDFRTYEQEWRIRPGGDAGRLVLEYRATVDPVRAAPDWIGRRVVRRSIERTLADTRAEAVRRAGPAGRDAPPDG